MDKVVLLFMAIHKGFERTSEANLTNLIGNLSVPAALLSLKILTFFLPSSEVTKILREKSPSEQDLELNYDLILRILA